MYARWRALGAVGKADHVIALCAARGDRAREHAGGRLRRRRAAVRAARARLRRERCRAWRSPRRRWRSPARAADRLGPSSTTGCTCRRPTARTTWVCSRTCSSTCPTRRRCSRRSRALSRGARGGAAGGQHLSAARGQARARGRGRPPAAPGPRGGAGDRRARGSVGGGGARRSAPLEVHRFFADTPRARALAGAKWALRASLHRLAPSAARRLFTVHYACLCVARAG